MKTGDLVKTIGLFPTIGVIKGFGYIPRDNNIHVFVKKENGQVVAIDAVWTKFEVVL